MNGEVTIRPAVRSDATEVAALLASQRQHLAPWDPRREPAFFTRGGQRARLSQVERERTAGTSFRFLILEGGELAGEVSITNIVRRSFQSANVGYWVAGELELHRLEAGTLMHNLASQIVLDRNGFVPFGVAPNYLRIAGAWCDHVLFQRTSDDRPRPLGATALARRITFLADPQ